jgi:hypothetical protein
MADRVKDACEANFEAHHADCSGFAKAVTGQLGVTLTGVADQIVDMLRAGGDWKLLANGVEAANSALVGNLVIGGLKGDEQAHPNAHGHVVVVVAGALAHGAYPSAYWGKLGGSGAKDQTINFAWNSEDRDNVTYAEHELPPATAG